jgi:hypothetical protein
MVRCLPIADDAKDEDEEGGSALWNGVATKVDRLDLGSGSTFGAGKGERGGGNGSSDGSWADAWRGCTEAMVGCTGEGSMETIVEERRRRVLVLDLDEEDVERGDVGRTANEGSSRSLIEEGDDASGGEWAGLLEGEREVWGDC